MAPRKILVTGATGAQGGATIKALLAEPPRFEHKILALTRNTSSSKAQALAANPNVEVISGDLDDSAAIFANVGGQDSIWGIFLVTIPVMGSKDTTNKEQEQGRALVDAAVTNGVRHFVYTSVDRGGHVRSDANPTKVPHFISKHRIEQHLKESSKGTNMTWTILRPVAFMDNLQPGFFCKMFNAMWLGMGDKKLQLVSTRDIGVFAANAFAGYYTEGYRNQAISLAGDELTQPEANEAFWRVYHRSLPRTYEIWGTLLQYMVAEVGTMFQWFKEEGYGADLQQCRRLNPKMQDLDAWLREESRHRQ